MAIQRVCKEFMPCGNVPGTACGRNGWPLRAVRQKGMAFARAVQLSALGPVWATEKSTAIFLRLESKGKVGYGGPLVKRWR